MREVWEETGIRAGNTQGTPCVSKKLAKAKVFEASYPFHKELTSGCFNSLTPMYDQDRIILLDNERASDQNKKKRSVQDCFLI